LAQKAASDLPIIRRLALYFKNCLPTSKAPPSPILAFGARLEDWTCQVAKTNPVNKQRETAVMWTLLLGLELSETKNYHRHNCEDGHAHTSGLVAFSSNQMLFWQRHEHGTLGQGIFFC